MFLLDMVLTIVCLFVLSIPLRPTLGVKVAMCNHFTTPVHTGICIDTLVQHFLPLLQLHFNLRDFNDGSCHVMNISTAKSNPDTGLFT